jgi:hypothetical protein
VRDTVERYDTLAAVAVCRESIAVVRKYFLAKIMVVAGSDKGYRDASVCPPFSHSFTSPAGDARPGIAPLPAGPLITGITPLSAGPLITEYKDVRFVGACQRNGRAVCPAHVRKQFKKGFSL